MIKHISKLLELETSNLVHGFVWRMTSGRTKISPKTGRGLGHVTHTIFGSTVGYPSDSLASCSVLYLVSVACHLSFLFVCCPSCEDHITCMTLYFCLLSAFLTAALMSCC